MKNLDNREIAETEEVEEAEDVVIEEGDIEEYVEFLEEELECALEAVESGRQALSTFVELLSFIKNNFGETADFPVRIDNDFYKEVFLKKLLDCEDNLSKFYKGQPLDLLDEDI